MTPPIDFKGQRALVTGGASGIGAETARLLLELNARVVLCDLAGDRVQQACDKLGAHGAVQGDVAVEADADRMVAEASDALGGIDLVFNAAGIGDDLVPLHEQSTKHWRRVFDVSLWGTLLISRAAGRLMVEQRSGAMVNVSSIVGLDAFPGRSAYGVAKAGVGHLTKTLACEWGEYGIRVNAIAPAYTKTPMVKDLLERKVFDPGVIERRTPLARMAETEEMAKAAVFLFSDWASYVTGVVLPVDGGWSAYGASGDVVKIRHATD
ncbi:SDR family oxidoreductase [Aquamicrobium sp. LC103]|uniref:SDR family NAD(P)-dependent oxidoreductase n=1 Tax=Aquamicrobium sp. LC103 TaxID=1120658 RepID=UPI00063EB8D9|nr:SDR family oxidoreductase [Aquamicrobium sp. LC103]TKT75720.1 SDR family oxidoreductase [Aquamicrobium sp. LC103]